MKNARQFLLSFLKYELTAVSVKKLFKKEDEMKKIKMDSLVAYSFIGLIILQNVPFSLALDSSFDLRQEPLLCLLIPFYGYLLYHIAQSERAFKMFAFLLLMNYNGVFAIGVGVLVFGLYVYKFCKPTAGELKSNSDNQIMFAHDLAGIHAGPLPPMPRKFVKNDPNYF